MAQILQDSDLLLNDLKTKSFFTKRKKFKEILQEAETSSKKVSLICAVANGYLDYEHEKFLGLTHFSTIIDFGKNCGLQVRDFFTISQELYKNNPEHAKNFETICIISGVIEKNDFRSLEEEVMQDLPNPEPHPYNYRAVAAAKNAIILPR
jgi:hypothetical protein